MDKEEIRKVVRKGYAKIAKQERSYCAPVKSCCGNTDSANYTRLDISHKSANHVRSDKCNP